MNKDKNVIICDKRGHEIDVSVNPSDVNRAINALSAIQKRSSFKASATHRHNRNWDAKNEEINVVLQRELKTMRARSRWLARNHPIGKSAVNTLLNYVVGTGFTLQMNVRKYVKKNGVVVAEDMTGFNDMVEDMFDLWSEDVSSNSNSTCPDDFADVQEMMLARLVEDGEIFVNMRYNKGKDIVPLELEFIDADQLDCNKTEHNGNPVMLGIELDKRTWKPIAYWFFSNANQSPRSYSKAQSVRVEAVNIVHLFVKFFPLQLRGIPFFASSSEQFFQQTEYDNAQLIRSKVNAMVALLISGGDGGGSLLQDSGASTEETNGFPVDAEGNILATLSPGIIGRIPDGFKAETVNPTSPENSYRAFMIQQEMAMGAGLEYGLSYSSLTRDTSETSFAGGRQAENMDTQAYRRLMRKFSRKGLSPIARRFVDTAVLSGALSIAGYELETKKWQRHNWMPAGWTRGINPLQEVNASAKSMENNITTLDDECAWQGRDYKVQLHKAARIKKMKSDLGLTAEDASAVIETEETAGKKMSESVALITEAAMHMTDAVDRLTQKG